MNKKAIFPAECLEDIFRTLSGNDLLECTLVSPSWNSFIGSTRSCIKKINLCFSNRYSNLDHINEVLKNSKRVYTRLRLEGDYSKGVQKMLSTYGNQWTHIIAATHFNFETINDFSEFLAIFQSSVVELSLPCARIELKCEPECETKLLQFP